MDSCSKELIDQHKTFESNIFTLQEKLTNIEKNMEATILQKVNERERELEKEYSAKERLMRESYYLLARRLHDAECSVLRLKSELNATTAELTHAHSESDYSIVTDGCSVRETCTVTCELAVPLAVDTRTIQSPTHTTETVNGGSRNLTTVTITKTDVSEVDSHSSAASFDSVSQQRNSSPLITCPCLQTDCMFPNGHIENILPSSPDNKCCCHPHSTEPSNIQPLSDHDLYSSTSTISSLSKMSPKADHSFGVEGCEKVGRGKKVGEVAGAGASSVGDACVGLIGVRGVDGDSGSGGSCCGRRGGEVGSFCAGGSVMDSSVGLRGNTVGCALDTVEVSQHIREILTTHSIGQRLFARHVLGLSQGTVSELLSKPKHWDKLTEKGRESYRRMNHWASDDTNIIALKAFAPKKSSSGVAMSNYEHDDSATDERIAQILSEAKTAMQLKQTGSGTKMNEAASAMVQSIYRQELARINWTAPDTSSCQTNQAREKQKSIKPSNKQKNHSNINSTNNNCYEAIRGRKLQTDDKTLTQDLVARIYHDELIKLAAAAKGSGNMDELNVYRQELDRLARTAMNQQTEPTKADLEDTAISGETQKNCNRDVDHDKPPLTIHVKSEKSLSDGQSSIDEARSSSLLLSAQPLLGTFQRSVKQTLSVSLGGTGCVDCCLTSMNNAPASSTDLPQDLRIKKETDIMRPSGSAFTVVRPRSAANIRGSMSPCQNSSSNGQFHSIISNNTTAVSTTISDGLSPLQQMQSIANSLLTKSQRPLRSVLPPITQEQVDRYTTVNTEELVRNIKDMLSQYSISQRLFGENVLGLSQGSVSDLLARPKPWHMLTQKGREPFIRMKVFLEDEESVTKLVATQYQIPADKFLRSSSAYSDCLTPGLPVDVVTTADRSPTLTLVSPTVPATTSVDSSNSNSSNCSSQSSKNATYSMTSNVNQPITSLWSKLTNHCVQQPSADHKFDGEQIHQSPELQVWSRFTAFGTSPRSSHPPLLSLGMHQSHALLPTMYPSFPPSYFHQSMLLELQRLSQQLNGYLTSPSEPPISSTGSTALQQPPSVFEIAAMTHELDTLEITTKVKEVLQFHNLGQKLFGEAVLGLSQGSVSELLSKPKPWHLLSLKGREPFLKMHMWLLDPLSVGRLRLYQDQLKVRKRKGSMEDLHQQQDQQQQFSDIIQMVQHKKPRVFFTDDQKHTLKLAYQTDPYPNQDVLESLANSLNVGTKTVLNWFHNHRMRAKQQQGTSMSTKLSCTAGLSPGGRAVYSNKAELMSEEDDIDDDISATSQTGGEEQDERTGFGFDGTAEKLDSVTSPPDCMLTDNTSTNSNYSSSAEEDDIDCEETPTRSSTCCTSNPLWISLSPSTVDIEEESGTTCKRDCTSQPSIKLTFSYCTNVLEETNRDEQCVSTVDEDDTSILQPSEDVNSGSIASDVGSVGVGLRCKIGFEDVNDMSRGVSVSGSGGGGTCIVVNKRKSARPQWMFEGTALDKLRNSCSGSATNHSESK